jgi:hypothetical protein
VEGSAQQRQAICDKPPAKLVEHVDDALDMRAFA